MSQLFRKEALENRHRSLYGEVVLTGPLSTWIITLLLICTVIGTLILLNFAHVDGPNGPLTLWEWLQGQGASKTTLDISPAKDITETLPNGPGS